MVIQSKKMANIYILEILKKYSDCDHRLTQIDIQGYLKKDYALDFERKSIRRNLMDLLEAGYDIECEYISRKNKYGEEEQIATNWYIENEFNNTELRFLIDGILFSKNIPKVQSQQLIVKLEGLSNIYFKSGMQDIRKSVKENKGVNQLFYTLEVLDEAIRTEKKICFKYTYYDVDKKLHIVKSSDGNDREYLVNPIQVAATNGKYYLIGNYDKYDDVSHYRIDRISDIEILDLPSKGKYEIKGLERGFDLEKHMSEHVYMYSGDSSLVEFKSKRSQISEIIDWFGTDVIFSNISDDEITVSLKTNLESFRFWALQYGKFVTVTKPEKLVKQLKEDVKDMYNRYME